MKLIIKLGQTIKMFNEDGKYADLIPFVEKNFDLMQNQYNIGFVDVEGDFVIVSSQNDLEVMKEILNNQKYGKLEIRTIENAQQIQQKEEEKI